ncbi:MAG: metallophosphoesterase [Actinomycetota bacterium]|nr:metallophosphoesterase [Actinomycetota bacterium]
MKIAITADIHLKTKKETPARWNALSNICDKILSYNINTLIIAGDLFDRESQNYPDFDRFCSQQKYAGSNLKFYVIPGNHDPSIKQEYFTSGNIKIFSSPEILASESSSLAFFFVPYIPVCSMGEIIAEYDKKLTGRWVLIGHGDYAAGMHNPNPYEPGIYMPLARNDIEYYNPSRVILGHIHKKTNLGKVYYPGSPCGLDVNETGKRSFLVLDADTLEIAEKQIETDHIFFNENLVSLPVTNEFEYIKKEINKMIDKWDLSGEEIPGVRLRLKVRGYTSSKKKLSETIKKELKSFSFYNKEQPDLTGVSLFNDPERISIVENIKNEIDGLELGNETFSREEDILEKALQIVLKE